jgi:hypothetical protein
VEEEIFIFRRKLIEENERYRLKILGFRRNAEIHNAIEICIVYKYKAKCDVFAVYKYRKPIADALEVALFSI